MVNMRRVSCRFFGRVYGTKASVILTKVDEEKRWTDLMRGLSCRDRVIALSLAARFGGTNMETQGTKSFYPRDERFSFRFLFVFSSISAHHV
jgi:hypothetical protein